MRFLRKGQEKPVVPTSERATGHAWVSVQRPERSDKAALMGYPHRYRGGLIMLQRNPPSAHADGVVFTRGIGMDGDVPLYTGSYADGESVELAEDHIIAPDAAALREAIAGAGPGASDAKWAAFYDVLRTSYVWMTADESGWPEDRSYEAWLSASYRAGDPEAFRDVESGPLAVFTDLERADAFHADAKLKAVAARVPFVVACRLATLFGNSDAILFNPGSEPFGALPRDIYPFILGSVVGYDVKVRPLPAEGLDRDWLTTVGSAATTEPGALAAYAWLTASPVDGPLGGRLVECLGLVLADTSGGVTFEHVRAAIRDRANAAGLARDRPYGVAEVALGGPQTSDSVNVIVLKGPPPRVDAVRGAAAGPGSP